MTKRALLALLGVSSFCFSSAAQQTFNAASTLSLYRPEILTSVDATALINGLPLLPVLDGRLPLSTELGRMGMVSTEFLSVAFAAPVNDYKTNVSPRYKAAAPREVTPLRLTPDYYVTGEVSFLYGRSTGRHGGDIWGSYIEGTTGNDKFQISVGASYEEFNGRVPRWAR
jgi:hypothetical protein